MIKRFKNKIKKHFEEVLRIKTTPKEIALGFAVGTFFANFPTFGLEFVLLFLLVAIYKKISKISLLLAYVVWNPLITYPLIAISYIIGNAILGNAPMVLVKLTIFQEVIRFTLRYIIGSFILAMFFAIISYFVVYYLSKKYQKRETPILQVPLPDDLFNI
ncbi:MAG: DUF2062 domain-containing protein [Nanoarchaeota archaeon]|nr:DUF2062 domain-containing protein [Nanoarchaeota archaeon]